YEEHVALLQVHHQCREVAAAFNRWSRSLTEVHAQLTRDDMRQRGFAQSGRTREQHVIEHVAAGARGLDGHCQDFLQTLLADELTEAVRPQGEIELMLFLRHGRSG